MLHTDLIAPIPDLLKRHAAARGSKIAYRDAQSSVTYAELLECTGRLAGHLADHGIAPNDTVAIMLPNSVQWIEACFAITRAGAVGVPISYDGTARCTGCAMPPPLAWTKPVVRYRRRLRFSGIAPIRWLTATWRNAALPKPQWPSRRRGDEP